MAADENWVSWHAVCCTVSFWKMVLHMIFRLFVNGKFTECLHFSMLHFPLCLAHASIWFCLSTVTFPTPLSMSLILGGAFNIQGHPLKNVHSWTFFLLFSSAHFQVVSTATVKVLHHFGFACARLILLLCCTYITDTKYAMLHVGWRKLPKGSTTPGF